MRCYRPAVLPTHPGAARTASHFGDARIKTPKHLDSAGLIDEVETSWIPKADGRRLAARLGVEAERPLSSRRP